MGWARAEGVVTKALLLVIFLIGLIAQFVKPVGDALEGKAYLGGALLSLVGYVLYAEVQRLNTAHEVQREGTGTLQAAARHLGEEVRRLNEEVQHLREDRLSQTPELVTPDDLKAEFEKALDAGGDVTFYVMGFTGETFALPLERVLENASENPQRTLKVRVLLPDFTKPIEVPGLVGADGQVRDAPAFRQSLVQQIMGYKARLERQKTRMRFKGQGELQVEFGFIHMSPPQKLYLINSDQAFVGSYDKIELRHGEFDSGSFTGEAGEAPGGQILDLLGYDSLLTHHRWDDGQLSRDVIVRKQRLFADLWERAHELP